MTNTMMAVDGRPQWSRVMAATVRFTRNLELAEVAVEDAFAHAQAEESDARLIGVARAMALHRLRRDMTYVSDLPLLNVPDSNTGDVVHDDRRALAYLCAHPALPMPARIALLLRLVYGAPVSAIAERLDASEADVVVLLSHAERQLRAQEIALEMPTDAQFAERVQPLLTHLGAGFPCSKRYHQTFNRPANRAQMALG